MDLEKLKEAKDLEEKINKIKGYESTINGKGEVGVGWMLEYYYKHLNDITIAACKAIVKADLRVQRETLERKLASL